MKKSALIKPCLNVAFGTLWLLGYLNLLSNGNAASISLGVIALVFSLGHIAYGLLSFFLENKFSEQGKNICDVLSICLFPLFIFAFTMTTVVLGYGNLGPAGWILALLALGSGIGFPALFAISYFLQKKELRPIVMLLGGLFGLSLLLSILFDFPGNPNDIGDISLLGLVLNALYVGLVGFVLKGMDFFAPAPKDEPSPEPASPEEETVKGEPEPFEEEPKPEEEEQAPVEEEPEGAE